MKNRQHHIGRAVLLSIGILAPHVTAAALVDLPLVQAASAQMRFTLMSYSGAGTAQTFTVPVTVSGYLQMDAGAGGAVVKGIHVDVTSLPDVFEATDVYGGQISITMKSMSWATLREFAVPYGQWGGTFATYPLYVDWYDTNRIYDISYGGDVRTGNDPGGSVLSQELRLGPNVVYEVGPDNVTLSALVIGSADELAEYYFDAGTIRFQGLQLTADKLEFGITAVPLPASFWLFSSGLMILFGWVRKRDNKMLQIFEWSVG